MSVATEKSAAAVDAPASDWVLVEFFLAIVAVAGSLYLTLGMGLVACPLCLYQRTLMVGVVGVLGVGVLAKVKPAGTLPLLALPLAAGGFAIVVFHTYLEYNGKLECPKGIGDFGSAPQQALLVQSLLLVLLLLDAVRCRGLLPGLGAVLLGGVFAVALIRTGPPAQLPRSADEPLKGCRPPYRPPAPVEAPPQG